jgi:predicted SAM-dependent methyltransferase
MKKLPKVLKLNLGGGDVPMKGYRNVDIKKGEQAFPLDYPDECADEIRASHILEHFGHEETMDVLREWYRVLKPGGMMKISVPDFAILNSVYSSPENHRYPVEGVIMGGHVDENDFHKAIFDKRKLNSQMRQIGLIRIEPWKSEIGDCASMDISLNMCGVKPTAEQEIQPTVQAVMSVPRLGFMDNFFCVTQLAAAGIPVRKFTGAFWGPCMERALQFAIDEGSDLVICMDYDTVFNLDHVAELMYAAKSYPEYDAFAPMQVSRGTEDLLMCTVDKEGNAVHEHKAKPYYDFDVVPVDSAHFGLTVIRTSALKKMNHPWFLGVPAPDGTWDDGRIDEDIFFWRQLKRSGGKLVMCPRVSIGHMELMVRWPGPDTHAVNQTVGDYHERGAPDNIWR